MVAREQDIFQLPFRLTEFNEDMLVALDRNFKELERVLSQFQMYEKLYGRPTNEKVDNILDEHGNVLTSKLSDKMVGLENQLQLANQAVDNAKLAVAAVLEDNLGDSAVSADKIAANAITAVKIAANAVVADKIMAGAVTADKINVNELSAITAYLGTVISGAIYSGLFRTGSEIATSYVTMNPDDEFLVVKDNNKQIAMSSNWYGGTINFYHANNVISRIYATGEGGINLLANYMLTPSYFRNYIYDMVGNSFSEDPAVGDVEGIAGFSINENVWELVLWGSLAPGTATFPDNFRIRFHNLGDNCQTLLRNLTTYGSKSAVVETKSYSHRLLYSRESPESRFVDEGEDTLVNGKCIINLDPVFLECIEPNIEGVKWNIQLTPKGPFGLYIHEIGHDYFVVHSIDGQTNGNFYWSLSATRKDYGGIRLAKNYTEEETLNALIEKYLDSNWEDDILG